MPSSKGEYETLILAELLLHNYYWKDFGRSKGWKTTIDREALLLKCERCLCSRKYICDYKTDSKAFINAQALIRMLVPDDVLNTGTFIRKPL
jgi:hypothetical protein